MDSSADQARAMTLAVLFHLVLIGLLWLSAYWVRPLRETSAAGEPIQASLQVSAADLRRARAAMKAQPAPTPEPPPAPQPLPSPQPETAQTPLQPLPQAPQVKPDTVDQQKISRLATEQADQAALQEQEERHRQEQVDLTEDQARQDEVERRQRLREQLDAVRLEREAATKRTRLEEQRLQQLADMRDAAAAVPPPRAANLGAKPAEAGNHGADLAGLLARYKAAMNQVARSNWNPIGAPELMHCQVRFTQSPDGEVLNVEFMSCPYDAEGRDFVDRALRKSPMPHVGFEPVFSRIVTLDFCHPEEECSR